MQATAGVELSLSQLLHELSEEDAADYGDSTPKGDHPEANTILLIDSSDEVNLVNQRGDPLNGTDHANPSDIRADAYVLSACLRLAGLGCHRPRSGDQPDGSEPRNRQTVELSDHGIHNPPEFSPSRSLAKERDGLALLFSRPLPAPNQKCDCCEVLDVCRSESTGLNLIHSRQEEEDARLVERLT